MKKFMCAPFCYSIFGIAILLLSGCTIPPDLAKRDVRSDLKKEITADQTNTVYPSHDWWRVYKDPQLDALMQEGLTQSPNLDQAQARLQKADALAQQAGAALLPSMSADLSFQKYKQSYNMGIPASFVPQNFKDLGAATFNFSYELDFLNKQHDFLAAIISEREAARLDVHQAQIMLSTSIAATYAQLIQLYAALHEAKDSVSVRTQTVRLFKERYKNGLENEGGVDQASANCAIAEADVASLQESVDLTTNALAALIGSTPDRARTIVEPKIKIARDTGILRPFTLPAKLPADLMSRRSDVIAARLRLEAAAKRIDVAKSGFYPNINFNASIGQQSLGMEYFFNKGSLVSSFGPAIHLPMFQEQKIEGLYRESYADYNALLAQYESTILRALHDVNDALTSQKALIDRIKKTKIALGAAERSYAVIRNRYKGGLATYLEVLRAEDTLIVSRRAMTDIQSRAFVLDVALVKSLGGGFKAEPQQ